MNRKAVFQYVLALAAAFMLGCVGTLALSYIDRHEIAPLEGGRSVAFSDFGFSLSVPDDAVVLDQTQESLEGGNDVLYAGTITSDEDILYLFIYENAAGDDLAAHEQQDVVTHYMSAGATDVRMRKFGGRPFICYRANVLFEEGRVEVWDSCETWNSEFQIVFETQVPPERVLPILATITFATP